MINITSISGVVSISKDGGIAKSYFGGVGKYTFLSNQTTLQVYIGGDNYTVELSDLQINGQTPSSYGEAVVLLNAVFTQDIANLAPGGGGSVDSVTGDLVTGTASDPIVDVAALTPKETLDGTEEVPLGGGEKTTTQDIADLGGFPSSGTLGAFQVSNGNGGFNASILREVSQEIRIPEGHLFGGLLGDEETGLRYTGDALLISGANKSAFLSSRKKSGIGDTDGSGNGNEIEVDDENATIRFLGAAASYEFSDNAAAITGGLLVGQIYRTGDVLKIVHA